MVFNGEDSGKIAFQLPNRLGNIGMATIACLGDQFLNQVVMQHDRTDQVDRGREHQPGKVGVQWSDHSALMEEFVIEDRVDLERFLP